MVIPALLYIHWAHLGRFGGGGPPIKDSLLCMYRIAWTQDGGYIFWKFLLELGSYLHKSFGDPDYVE